MESCSDFGLLQGMKRNTQENILLIASSRRYDPEHITGVSTPGYYLAPLSMFALISDMLPRYLGSFQLSFRRRIEMSSRRWANRRFSGGTVRR